MVKQRLPEQYNIFLFIRILSLERAGHDQHRLYSPHTKVIMVLLGQLFRAQSVHSHHLVS